jgi:hypothetical protein
VTVLAEVRGSCGNTALDHHGASAVEWMGERRIGLDPIDLQVRQRGRRERHRVHRGAHVVREAGQRERGRADAAADLVARFEHAHRGARTCELDGGDEPVRARADDDGVDHVSP